MPKRKRSQARMLALQALCAYDALDNSFDEQLNEFLSDALAHEDLEIESPADQEIVLFARRLARETHVRRRELDKRLASAATHWSLDRMSLVDRNVLRMSLWEMLACAETPPVTAIDEAIELARRFGDTNSPGFVNGVLDSLKRALEESGELAAAEAKPRAQEPPSNADEPRGDDGTV